MPAFRTSPAYASRLGLPGNGVPIEPTISRSGRLSGWKHFALLADRRPEHVACGADPAEGHLEPVRRRRRQVGDRMVDDPASPGRLPSVGCFGRQPAAEVGSRAAPLAGADRSGLREQLEAHRQLRVPVTGRITAVTETRR